MRGIELPHSVAGAATEIVGADFTAVPQHADSRVEPLNPPVAYRRNVFLELKRIGWIIVAWLHFEHDCKAGGFETPTFRPTVRHCDPPSAGRRPTRVGFVPGRD